MRSLQPDECQPKAVPQDLRPRQGMHSLEHIHFYTSQGVCPDLVFEAKATLWLHA